VLAFRKLVLIRKLKINVGGGSSVFDDGFHPQGFGIVGNGGGLFRCSGLVVFFGGRGPGSERDSGGSSASQDLAGFGPWSLDNVVFSGSRDGGGTVAMLPVQLRFQC